MPRRRRATDKVSYVSFYPSLRGSNTKLKAMGITPNRQGLGQFLTARKVNKLLVQKARQVAQAAGPGMVDDQTSRGLRSRTSVRTHTYQAMRGQAKDKRLTKALRAAR